MAYNNGGEDKEDHVITSKILYNNVGEEDEDFDLNTLAKDCMVIII